MAFENGLGFTYEALWPKRSDGVVYEAYFKTARACVWLRGKDKNKFAVNIYQIAYPIKEVKESYPNLYPTDRRLRVCPNQDPINVEDELEALLAINYLMQTHLPSEVIE